MRPNCVLAGVVVIVTAAVYAPLATGADQPASLPPDVLVATDILSAQQQASIDEYAAAWVNHMAGDDPEQVKEARSQLIAPLRMPGISPTFVKQYNIAVLNRLKRLVVAQPVDPADGNNEEMPDATIALLRNVNVMIVLTHLSGQGVLDLMTVGLTDANAAVRYWAAKAVARITRQDEGLSEDDQRQVLNLLDQALGAETSPEVLAELLNALNALDIPGAKQVLLNSLNARVLIHIRQPEDPYLPEHNALQQLYLDMLRLNVRGQANADQIRELARVAFRYMVLVAEQLDADHNFDPDTKSDHKRMVELGDTVLRFAVPILLKPQSKRLPAKIDNALRLETWAFVLVEIRRWKEILLRELPINLKAEELDIRDPDAQSAQP
jgi:hypothetical protein